MPSSSYLVMHDELIVNLCNVKVPVQKSRCDPKFEIELLQKFRNMFLETVGYLESPYASFIWGPRILFYATVSSSPAFLCIIHTTGSDSCTVILEKC